MIGAQDASLEATNLGDQLFHGGQLAQCCPISAGSEQWRNSHCAAITIGIHVFMEPLVSTDHGILNGCLPRPDQGQHASQSFHSIQNTELEKVDNF